MTITDPSAPSVTRVLQVTTTQQARDIVSSGLASTGADYLADAVEALETDGLEVTPDSLPSVWIHAYATLMDIAHWSSQEPGVLTSSAIEALA